MIQQGTKVLLHCDTLEGHCPTPIESDTMFFVCVWGKSKRTRLLLLRWRRFIVYKRKSIARRRDISESRVNVTKPHHVIRGSGEPGDQEAKRQKGSSNQNV